MTNRDEHNDFLQGCDTEARNTARAIHEGNGCPGDDDCPRWILSPMDTWEGCMAHDTPLPPHPEDDPARYDA